MGPGCGDPVNRLAFVQQLTSDEAAAYTLENIFAASSYIGFRDNWLPPCQHEVATHLHDVEQRGSLQLKPNYTKLHANFPNPFNPITVIPFELTMSGYVRLTVHDMLGRNVATLVDSMQQGGRHEVAFYAGNLSSGVYIYNLETEQGRITRYMSLLK
jgi:hypothetical protein